MLTEGLMQNLDKIVLAVLAIAGIMGGGLYFWSRRSEPVDVEKTPAETQPEDFGFETAEELLPVHFPEEPEPDEISELPWRYSDDKITIMARDPETVFTYWDISKEKQTSLAHTYGAKWHEAKPILRVHEISEETPDKPASHYWDIDVDERAGTWYLNQVNPGQTYYVELGRIIDETLFVTIASSNYTQTPRNSLSDKIDPDWMLVSENERKLFGRIQLDGESSLALFKN